MSANASNAAGKFEKHLHDSSHMLASTALYGQMLVLLRVAGYMECSARPSTARAASFRDSDKVG